MVVYAGLSLTHSHTEETHIFCFSPGRAYRCVCVCVRVMQGRNAAYFIRAAESPFFSHWFWVVLRSDHLRAPLISSVLGCIRPNHVGWVFKYLSCRIVMFSYANTPLSPSLTFSSQEPAGGYRSDKRSRRGRGEQTLGLDGRRGSEKEMG